MSIGALQYQILKLYLPFKKRALCFSSSTGEKELIVLVSALVFRRMNDSQLELAWIELLLVAK